MKDTNIVFDAINELGNGQRGPHIKSLLSYLKDTNPKMTVPKVKLALQRLKDEGTIKEKDEKFLICAKVMNVFAKNPVCSVCSKKRIVHRSKSECKNKLKVKRSSKCKRRSMKMQKKKCVKKLKRIAKPKCPTKKPMKKKCAPKKRSVCLKQKKKPAESKKCEPKNMTKAENDMKDDLMENDKSCYMIADKCNQHRDDLNVEHQGETSESSFERTPIIEYIN